MIQDEIQFISSIKTKQGPMVEVLYKDFDTLEEKKAFEKALNI